MKKALTFFIVLFLLSATLFCQYTTLYNCANDSNGTLPSCTLISDSTFLYGTSRFGGLYNYGTIFKITPDGSSYSKLYDFDYTSTHPVGSLISDGIHFYGMTGTGGVSDQGTVFKIQHNGSGFDTLLTFTDSINGSSPNGSLLLDSSWLYGVTSQGGDNNFGTLFKVMIDGSNYVKLLDFDSANTGSWPSGGLIIVEPYLYGVTFYGGTSDKGVIYRVMKDGTGFTSIMNLDGINSGCCLSSDLLYQGGFLYGMTAGGGANSQGTIFKIDTAGNNYSKLLDFNGMGNGSYPYGSLISDGIYLYGMTTGGGAYLGTIFRILPDGSGYTKYHDFLGSSGDGISPNASLYSDGEYFYGTTYGGGINNLGTVFRFKYDTFGKEEESEQKNLLVFPNPTIGELNLISPIDLNDACVEVFNMLGQQVLKKCSVDLQKGNSYLLNLSILTQGSYILHIDGYKRIIIKQ